MCEGVVLSTSKHFNFVQSNRMESNLVWNQICLGCWTADVDHRCLNPTTRQMEKEKNVVDYTLFANIKYSTRVHSKFIWGYHFWKNKEFFSMLAV